MLDTQAGFKAFDPAALGPVIRQMISFNETFDVESLIHLAQHYDHRPWPSSPIVFTEDFAATTFPSVEPGGSRDRQQRRRRRAGTGRLRLRRRLPARPLYGQVDRRRRSRSRVVLGDRKRMRNVPESGWPTR